MAPWVALSYVLTLLLLVALGALVFLVLLGLVLAVWFAPEVRACLDRDPAARNRIEMLLTYSGLHALVFHRIAQSLHRVQVPVLPRLIMTWARLLTGIEIHPGAQIGRGLFIDHGMGVVIGETTIIGDNVTMYQGVTLGGTGKERGKRHPTIGSNVVIGAGAKVLGNISIGNGSLVGANAVVIQDVPENSTVVGVPGRVVRSREPAAQLDHSHLPDPIFDRLATLQKEVEELERHFEERRKNNPPSGK